MISIDLLLGRSGSTMKITLCLLLVALTINFNKVNSLDILGIFPYHGKSHFFVFEPYLRELTRRGHNVTVISYFPQKQTIQNYTDISLADKTEIFEDVVNMDQTIWSSIKLLKKVVDAVLDNCRILLEHQSVQNLVQSRTKFDLVVVEAFLGDCALSVAYKLGAPVVALTSHALSPAHYERFGVPYPILHLDPNPDFLSRLGITAFLEGWQLIFRWFNNEEQAILKQYFDDIPPLEELGREIKVILTYTHSSMFGPQALPKSIHEVGGYHVAETKPLPDKLRDFIEQSEHGIIYVSFGSMIKPTSLPKEKLEAIIGALSKLPQRVVMKWGEEHLPGNPKNIYVSKWLPQNDILAHPNIVAFYTHGGLLGLTEAIHHGVPVVVTPVFAEQPMNAKAIERKGFGVQMDYSELTKDLLLERFKTVLDPDFRRRAKEISREWHDRPMSPMDSAIYWTEYAVRHPGSTLRAPSVGKPQYQLAGLDVLFTFYCLLFACLFALVSLIKYLINGRGKSKSKKD